jgi:hypothetical protein
MQAIELHSETASEGLVVEDLFIPQSIAVDSAFNSLPHFPNPVCIDRQNIKIMTNSERTGYTLMPGFARARSFRYAP